MGYDKRSMKAEEFINDEEIRRVLFLGSKKSDNKEEVLRIIEKAETLCGLSIEEAATLAYVAEPKLKKRMFEAAKTIKDRIYGRRIVMFAPLYLSDYCVNGCKYCEYNCKSGMNRKRLDHDEIEAEVRALEEMGHKRLALEAGEDPQNCPIEYILDAIKTVYGVKLKNGEIRRVNINIAATTVENYRKLKEAGIGTYILFQETYNKQRYEELHTGPKADYEYHTTAMDRAQQGGIDDVGIGALFGLYSDWRYDLMGLFMHAEHLESVFGVGPHTISVPRVKPTHDVDTSLFTPVSDEDFKRITAIIRLTVPYTGLIISTRESEEMRAQLIELGVSQLSAGSATGVGGYTKMGQKPQFIVSDERTPLEVTKDLMQRGYIPSFCTACYRAGRTGDRFMQFAKSGNICNFCQPNALMTLKEYACDYGDAEFCELADRLIAEEIKRVPDETVRQKALDNLQAIEAGQRDFRF